ncbi:amidohydrolase [Lachnospiraceae bacterium 54-53]
MLKIYNPDYLFVNGRFQKNLAVAVKGDAVIGINTPDGLAVQYPLAKVERLENSAVVPGTVNAHNHSFQSLLRGIASDRPFLEWRDNALYKYSPAMNLDDIYAGAVFAFAEMMKCGVTTVSDFFYLHNFGTESDEAVIQAAKDVGIRLVLARTMYDWAGAPVGYRESVEQAVENTKKLALKYNGAGNMVKIIPAPHSLHGASPEMITAGHKLAHELGTGYHIHVAEEPFEVEEVKKAHNGFHTIEYLDTLGVVDEAMSIVHGVWLNSTEIELMGKKGASLIYCPSSNMFLADGITDIPKMLAAGVKIALGSDGACSNNRISVFEEMRMTSILQKAKTCDAMCVNYNQTFAMGTVNGAEILGLKTGALKSGYSADFVAIDMKHFSVQPLFSTGEQLLPNVVYSMQPEAIKLVVVNGKETVRNGELQTIKESKVSDLIKGVMQRFEQV